MHVARAFCVQTSANGSGGAKSGKRLPTNNCTPWKHVFWVGGLGFRGSVVYVSLDPESDFSALRGPGAEYPLQNIGCLACRGDPGADYPLQRVLPNRGITTFWSGYSALGSPLQAQRPLFWNGYSALGSFLERIFRSGMSSSDPASYILEQIFRSRASEVQEYPDPRPTKPGPRGP